MRGCDPPDGAVSEVRAAHLRTRALVGEGSWRLDERAPGVHDCDGIFRLRRTDCPPTPKASILIGGGKRPQHHASLTDPYRRLLNRDFRPCSQATGTSMFVDDEGES